MELKWLFICIAAIFVTSTTASMYTERLTTACLISYTQSSKTARQIEQICSNL